MNNILLRFRDTDQKNTIKEHKDLIKQFGFTWWGWWKKDTEKDRSDILKQIRLEPGHYQFFLFDRSTDKFYLAKMEETFYSKNEKTPSPDKEKTPPYYNSSNLIAWFKFTDIKTFAKDEFLKMFSIIPNQDSTFFTDKDILDEKTSTVKRIKTKSNFILHLSDIHFGADFGFPAISKPNNRSLNDILTDFIKYDFCEQIGLLIISGDITSRADANYLLNDGVSFIQYLSEMLQIKKECIVIIPGNHDIPIKDANFHDYNHENVFKLFLKQVYGYDKDLYGLELFEFPNGTKLDLLRIHSVKLRSKEDSNYGYVNWYTYRDIANSKNLNGDLRMAVMHHHLVSVPIEETLDTSYPYGSISVTIDSGRVIEGLQQCDIKFVLNGHQHIPGITKISRGMKNDQNEINDLEEKQVYILSAGSAGVKKERYSAQGIKNSFSIYEVEKDRLNIEVKTFNSSDEPKRHYKSTIKY